ncbi:MULTISPECIES: DUF6916 family protein [Kordiimonas]|jgi:hypothetical protein|uniref:DUF6916 family protein n=1 Tax=Kordiimonas TaxID=288021 RepID=UPI00257E74CE|nr:hypothetical protein [Kordiimonas sp. UBA4487]
MLDKVTSKNFKDIIGSKVTLTIMDGPDIDLTVEEVHEVKIKKDDERPAGCRKKPFTVILSGPESYQAPDGCYNLAVDKVGVLEGLYVDNKADNPESEDFNTEAMKKAAAAAKKKAPAKAKKKADDVTVVDTEQETQPSPVVLYEINFG